MSKEVSYYDRVTIPPSLQEVEVDQALAEVAEVMRTVGRMLNHTMRAGEADEDLGCGLEYIFLQQFFVVRGIQQELRKRDAEQEVVSGPKRRTPDGALNDAAYKLRLDMIESSTKAGADTRLIAAAMNLSDDAIQGVVNRLRSEAAPAAKAAGRRASA